MQPLNEILSLNTDLLLNCLHGLSEEDALRQFTAQTNNIAFLVAHAVDARHYMAKCLGMPLENPLEKALTDVNSIEEAKTLPTLGELRSQWIKVSEHLAACFCEASADQLAAPADQAFPVTDRSLLGCLAFLLQHDSYHLGQVALLRRQWGYEAMSYSRGD